MAVHNDESSPHTGDPVWAGERLVGVVTSGAYGHSTETNIAMGYVEPRYDAPGTELAIDVVGKRCKGVVNAQPMFDPTHDRPRTDVDQRR